MAKSSGMKDACYATGGAVLGKTSEFMKTPDRFRGEQTDPNVFGKGIGAQAGGKPNPKVKLPQGKSAKQ